MALKRRWKPFAARGALSLVLSFVGGALWLLSTLYTLFAEIFPGDPSVCAPAGTEQNRTMIVPPLS